MKKKSLLHALQTAAFCMVLLCVLLAVTKLVERKASEIRLRPFLRSAEDYDVLFIGDSHMVNGVFPMELWQDYGIAAYNISSYGNTLPVSYWVLMNALIDASPQVVVIDVKDADKSYKLSGNSSDAHTALDGFPLTLTKARAIEDLMSEPYAMDDEGNYYADLKWEYYFTLGKYHTRWSELTPGDWNVAYSRQKGAEMVIGVAEPDDYDIIDERQAFEESGWGFVYLRRMIEACQERGIDVLLTHLPYPASEESQMAGNAVRYIAEEYGVGYIDFVSLDQVADYRTDCYDSFSHLNPSGARKVTDYLGRYLREHYDLPDRRGDAHYQAWEQEVEDYIRLKIDLLAAQDDLINTLMLLHDGNFSVCLAVDGDSPLYESERLMLLLQNIAREHIYEEDEFSKWSNALFPLEALEDAAAERAGYVLLVDRLGSTLSERAGETEGAVEASFGRLSFETTAEGVTLRLDGDGGVKARLEPDGDVRILVIDNRTGEVVLQRSFAL